MARSKNNSRSRANNQTQQRAACPIRDPHCRGVQCVTDRNLAGRNSSTPASLGHRNPQDVRNSIEYHWRVLTTEVKYFLFANKSTLNLRKLINFWSEPHRIRTTVGCSASGSSWFLALNYLFLNKLVEAQALILNGAFLEECRHRPIEQIVTLCNTMNEQGAIEYEFDQKLPCFRDAFRSTLNKQSMESFLQNVLSPDYIRQMSFAAQATRPSSHTIVGDYVNFISNDWNGASSSSAASARRQTKGINDTSIEVVFKTDTNKEINVKIGMTTTLKSIFNNYAKLRKISLRLLRFTYAGKILFLSSASNITAEQLGIKHLDSIHVSSTSSSPSVVPTSVEKSARESPQISHSGDKKKGKENNERQSRNIPAVPAIGTEEQDKIQHSKQLSCIFAEVEPILKSIRQRLNSLTIERTLPKRKRPNQKESKAVVAPLPNPSTTGIGGKAGKSQFLVHVGETCNLYKTTKQSLRSLQRQTLIVMDLHGFTKEEALSKLDEELNDWKDIAMKGLYPFVIRVAIICGGGNQVLSEAVEKWVRQDKNIAFAPKNYVV